MRSVALSCLLLGAVRADATDLVESLREAIRSDPSIRKAEVHRRAVSEGKRQAVGALLPQLTGGTSYEWTQLRDDTTQPLPPFGQAAFVKDVRNQAFRWSVDLSQTLFRWDQFQTLKRAEQEGLQAEVDYSAAELDLYIRVADAYFGILASEAKVASAGAALEAILRQLEQAQQRYEAGLKAPTDVLEAQSAADRARAAEIRAKRDLANAREALREITNVLPDRLARPGTEIPLEAPNPADENQWVDMATSQNLRVQSAQIGVEIARAEARVARGGHLPQLDLVGSYHDYDVDGSEQLYYSLFSGPFIPQTGDIDQFGNDYRIAVQLSVPLFSGGITSSRVNQAVYRQREAMEQLEITTRETQRETRDAYQAVISDIAEVRATEQALNSSRESVAATEAGFEVGNRNTVDLLISRQQLFLAETDHARARYTYIVDVLRLKQAVGTLSPTDIENVNAWLTDRVAGSPDANSIGNHP